MKKFENLGRSLSDEEKRKINGGTGEGCSEGSNYCCDVHKREPDEWVTDNTCATSAYLAEAAMINKYHNNCLDVNCELAS
jgi:hypothetical protein